MYVTFSASERDSDTAEDWRERPGSKVLEIWPVLSVRWKVSLNQTDSKPRRGSSILKWGVNSCNFWGEFLTVCGLKMNKLIGRISHRLCTFSTSIREIKYYFDIWGIRKKKRKKGAQKKGGENSPISPPLDPRLKPYLRARQKPKTNRRWVKLVSKRSVSVYRGFPSRWLLWVVTGSSPPRRKKTKNAWSQVRKKKTSAQM